jgi:23S rRNA (uracil1939-C5)-methyltransferase
MNLELEIDALAFGGNGIGRLDGKAVFVPFTAPGDRISCRIVRDKKRYAEGECVELLRPSMVRREPPCPVFGRCGGCQWQHLPYPDQCRWKEKIFTDLLERQAGASGAAVRPIVASPSQWHYRSRVQFKCRQTVDGFVMGFYRRASHFVIDVAHCPITEEPLNAVLRLFRRWLPSSPCPGEIPQVDMDLGDDGHVRTVVHYIGSDAGALFDYLYPLGKEAGVSIFVQQGRKESLTRVCGDEDLNIRVGAPPIEVAYGPGGFAQINRSQNRTLVNEVEQAARMTGSEMVLDLFCGAGNFSLPMARNARHVIGIEGYAPAIEKARQNARTNGLENVEFHAAAAEDFQSYLRGSIDVVVLDPPREGAWSVIKALLDTRPGRILYISCDPSTLARDLRPLLHGGYELSWSRPFDLFPQTHHIESLSILESC